MDRALKYPLIIFQSTHPARGATYDAMMQRKAAEISIHAPREGCDVQPYLRPYCIPISIHAPREGCDLPSVIKRT